MQKQEPTSSSIFSDTPRSVLSSESVVQRLTHRTHGVQQFALLDAVRIYPSAVGRRHGRGLDELGEEDAVGVTGQVRRGELRVDKVVSDRERGAELQERGGESTKE